MRILVSLMFIFSLLSCTHSHEGTTPEDIRRRVRVQIQRSEVFHTHLHNLERNIRASQTAETAALRARIAELEALVKKQCLEN